MPDIRIKLATEHQDAADDIKQYCDEIKSSITSAYSQAIDTAQRKIDDLNGMMRVHQGVIEKTGEEIKNLQRLQATASQAEQANIQVEIDKLTALSRQRELDINTIQKQIEIQAQKGLLAAASTDAERENMRRLSEQRMVELGALRDQIRGQTGLKDVSAEAAAQMKADMDSLLAKHHEHTQVIESDKQRIAQLQEQRKKASDAEKQQIDNEVAQLRKLIANREEEILKIEIKKARLEETAQISQAKSQREIDDIKKSTQEYITQIESIRDSERAQRQAGQAVDQTTDSMKNLMHVAGQLTGIVGIIGAVNAAFQLWLNTLQNTSKAIKDMFDASEHFKDLNQSIMQKALPFLNEMGITDPTQQRNAMDVLFKNIAPNTSIPQETVASAATAMAPMLKAAGIGVNDPRFAGLVSAGANMVYRGADATRVGDFFNDQLQANPNLTGDQFNQAFSNVNQIAGSPKYGSELIGIGEEQKAKTLAGKFSFEDIEKMYSSLRSHGIRPEFAGNAVRSYVQGVDRLVGGDAQNAVDILKKASNLNQNELAQFDEMTADIKDPQMRLQMLMKFKSVGAFSSLFPMFTDIAAGKQISERDFGALASKLPPELAERLLHAEGGPRAVTGESSLGDWSSVDLGGNAPLTPFPSSAVEQGASRREADQYQAAIDNATHPGLEDFKEKSTQIGEYLKGHPELYQGVYNPSSWGFGLSDSIKSVTSGGATPERQAQFYALGDLYVSLAQELNDIDSGKIKATKTQRDNVQLKMQNVAAMLGLTKVQQVKAGTQPLFQLMNDQKRPGALQQLQDQHSRYEMFRDALDTRQSASLNAQGNIDNNDIPPWLSPDEAGDAFDNATNAARVVDPNFRSTPKGSPVQGPPAPVKSGPVSVNYNIRQTNYGYGYDSIGVPEAYSNNFG